MTHGYGIIQHQLVRGGVNSLLAVSSVRTVYHMFWNTSWKDCLGPGPEWVNGLLDEGERELLLHKSSGRGGSF